MSELGRREEALAATQEAVELYGELAKARPDAFRPDLARSLAVRGMVLRSTGDTREAASSFADGLRLMLPLFDRNPQAHARLVISMTLELIKTCESASIPIPEDLAEPVERITSRLDGDDTSC